MPDDVVHIDEKTRYWAGLLWLLGDHKDAELVIRVSGAPMRSGRGVLAACGQEVLAKVRELHACGCSDQDMAKELSKLAGKDISRFRIATIVENHITSKKKRGNAGPDIFGSKKGAARFAFRRR